MGCAIMSHNKNTCKHKTLRKGFLTAGTCSVRCKVVIV